MILEYMLGVVIVIDVFKIGGVVGDIEGRLKVIGLVFGFGG